MKKVKIKRIKRERKTITAKEKLLAGLGVGAGLIGGVGAVGQAQTIQPIVSTKQAVSSTSRQSVAGRVKQILTDVFGIHEAKADEGFGICFGEDFWGWFYGYGFQGVSAGGGGGGDWTDVWDSATGGEYGTYGSYGGTSSTAGTGSTGDWGDVWSNATGGEYGTYGSYYGTGSTGDWGDVWSNATGGQYGTYGSYGGGTSESTGGGASGSYEETGEGSYRTPAPSDLGGVTSNQDSGQSGVGQQVAEQPTATPDGLPFTEWSGNVATDAMGNKWTWDGEQLVKQSSQTDLQNLPASQSPGSIDLLNPAPASGNVIAVAEDGTLLYANPNDPTGRTFISGDNKVYETGSEGQPVEQLQPSITVTEKVDPIPTLQAVFDYQGHQTTDVNGNKVYVDSNGQYQSDSGNLNYVNGQYEVAVPQAGEFRTGLDGRNYYYIPETGEWVSSDGARWGGSVSNLSGNQNTQTPNQLNPNSQASDGIVQLEDGTWMNIYSGQIYDSQEQAIEALNSAGQASNPGGGNQTDTQTGSGETEIETSGWFSGSQENLNQGSGEAYPVSLQQFLNPANDSQPNAANQTVFDANAQLAAQIAAIQAANPAVPEPSVIASPSLQFTPIILSDGGKLTTTDGVNYYDAGDSTGNRYQYDSATGQLNLITSASSQPVNLAQNIMNTASNTINKIGQVQQQAEEKVGKLVNTGVNKIGSLFGKDSNKPDGKASDGTELYNLGTKKNPVWIDWYGNVYTGNKGSKTDQNLDRMTSDEVNKLFSASNPSTSLVNNIIKAGTNPLGAVTNLVAKSGRSNVPNDAYSSDGKSTPLYNLGSKENPEYVDWYGFKYDQNGQPLGSNMDSSYQDSLNLIKTQQARIFSAAKNAAQGAAAGSMLGPFGAAGGAAFNVLKKASQSGENWNKVVDWAFNPATFYTPGTVSFVNPNTGKKESLSKDDFRQLVWGDPNQSISQDQADLIKVWNMFNKVEKP